MLTVNVDEFRSRTWGLCACTDHVVCKPLTVSSKQHAGSDYYIDLQTTVPPAGDCRERCLFCCYYQLRNNK